MLLTNDAHIVASGPTTYPVTLLAASRVYGNNPNTYCRYTSASTTMTAERMKRSPASRKVHSLLTLTTSCDLAARDSIFCPYRRSSSASSFRLSQMTATTSTTKTSVATAAAMRRPPQSRRGPVGAVGNNGRLNAREVQRGEHFARHALNHRIRVIDAHDEVPVGHDGCGDIGLLEAQRLGPHGWVLSQGRGSGRRSRWRAALPGRRRPPARAGPGRRPPSPALSGLPVRGGRRPAQDLAAGRRPEAPGLPAARWRRRQYGSVLSARHVSPLKGVRICRLG